MRASSDQDPGGLRASDAERDLAVDELRDRFAEGRISQDTFLHRMDAALRAKDRSELSDLLRDLPGARIEREALVLARGATPGTPVARHTVLDRLARLAQAAAGKLAALRPPAPGQPAPGQPAPKRADGMLAARRRLAVVRQPEPLPLCLPPHRDGRFTIGRALACDFTLADLSVSRWHAKLHKEEEHWMLSDLGSTNGTRLNGWRVTTGVPVRPGDRVSFGSVTFVITERPVGAA